MQELKLIHSNQSPNVDDVGVIVNNPNSAVIRFVIFL